MAPTSGSAVFIDTNILVYASFPGTPFYYAARARLGGLERDGVLFWTSRQVLPEFLASTTRPGAVVPTPTLSLKLFASLRLNSRLPTRTLPSPLSCLTC